MAVTRFQVSTNRTGIHRIIRVRLYDTAEELQAAHDRAWPESPVAGGGQVEGLFVPRDDWDDRDPDPWQGTIWLPRDLVTATSLVHEVSHAAAHLYSVDSYRQHARAAAHLHGRNEIMAYLCGDLFSHIARALSRRGVVLDVGRAAYYGASEYPYRPPLVQQPGPSL